jgi:hypothetical protein
MAASLSAKKRDRGSATHHQDRGNGARIKTRQGDFLTDMQQHGNGNDHRRYPRRVTHERQNGNCRWRCYGSE